VKFSTLVSPASNTAFLDPAPASAVLPGHCDVVGSGEILPVGSFAGQPNGVLLSG
jgi:hypothetical protein